jgi:hypothetical protein
MNTEAIHNFISYLTSKSYSLSKKDVKYNVVFVKNGLEKPLLTSDKREIISQIKDNISLFNPDVVKVELLYDGRKETQELMLKGQSSSENIIRPEIQSPQANFWQEPQFGSIDPPASVNQQVQSLLKQELEKELNIRDIAELNRKLHEKTKLLEQQETQIQELNTKQALTLEKLANEREAEVSSLKIELEEKHKEIEHLEKVLSDKKNFKYYAGLTGDILQSFGIKKEMVAKPLAGLLAGSQDGEATAIEKNASSDASGIVEEDAPVSQPKNRRQEMIDLLTMYLKNIDTATLEKLFAIFSEVEDDHDKADQILIYLNQIAEKP